MDQGDCGRSPMPAIARLSPAKNRLCSCRFRKDHGTDQAVDQCVVIGPVAYAIEPAFEQLELLRGEAARLSLQNQHGEYFLFQDTAGEELVDTRIAKSMP